VRRNNSKQSTDWTPEGKTVTDIDPAGKQTVTKFDAAGQQIEPKPINDTATPPPEKINGDVPAAAAKTLDPQLKASIDKAGLDYANTLLKSDATFGQKGELTQAQQRLMFTIMGNIKAKGGGPEGLAELQSAINQQLQQSKSPFQVGLATNDKGVFFAAVARENAGGNIYSSDQLPENMDPGSVINPNSLTRKSHKIET
jgi:hypothetical protein